MNMRHAWVLLFASGCNSTFGLDPTVTRFDAAPIDGPGCSDGVFSAPQPLAEFGDDVSSDSEFEPQLRHDRLEVWWIQLVSGNADLYRATRPDQAASFGPRELVFGGPDHDTAPSLTGDGLRLVFSSDRAGSPEAWEMTRPTLNEPFAAPRNLLGLGALGSQTLDISFDGKTLYFVADGNNTMAASRPDFTSPFGAATLIAEGTNWPSISSDGLEIFFNTATGSVERRARSSTVAPFSATGQLIFDQADDPDLTADGSTLIVGRNRTLAIVTRSCP